MLICRAQLSLELSVKIAHSETRILGGSKADSFLPHVPTGSALVEMMMMMRSLSFDTSALLPSETEVIADRYSCRLVSSCFLLLRNVPCRNTNLESADLEGADFSGAVLEGAMVTNARFRDNNLDGSDWTDVLLRKDQLKILCTKATGTNPVTGVDTRESLNCP